MIAFARPSATTSNDFTLVGATAHGAIDDAVTDPTAASFTDKLSQSAATNAAVFEVDLSGVPTGAVVSNIAIKAYVQCGITEASISASLVDGDLTEHGPAVVAAAEGDGIAASWKSADLNAVPLSLAAASLTGSVLNLTGIITSGAGWEIAAIYLVITYSIAGGSLNTVSVSITGGKVGL